MLLSYAAGARFRYGFDESILDVDADHNPNHFVGLRRAYSLALGGWAVGANLKLISAIRARNAGIARPDYIEPYEQANLTRRNMSATRNRVFPPTEQSSAPSAVDIESPSPPVDPHELGIMIDRFCNQGIDVYAYFTPTHARKQSCDLQAGDEITALDFLRRKQSTCGTKIHYFNFAYPNAVTLEGVLIPVKSSEYYRPDTHPRPSVGLLMAASMFGREFPAGTPALLAQDFGVDLLSHPNSEEWLLERAARCQGDWGDEGYSDYLIPLTKP